MAVTVVSPVPYQPIAAQSGTIYTPDSAGVITSVALVDLRSLRNAGCEQVGVSSPSLIGRLLGVNMNTTANPGQRIPMFNGTQPFRVTKITVKNASTDLTTAVGGIYPAIDKGGTALVANSQAYSALSAANLALDLTIVATPGVTEYAATQGLWFALTTAQGSAATADLFVYGDIGS